MSRNGLAWPLVVPLLFALFGCAANSAKPPALDQPLDSYVLKINKTPGADALAATLRNAGYSVNVILDSQTPQDLNDAANYPVISVGKEVPVSIAARAIRIAHEQMPSIRFVFLQYDQASFDRQLLINAHKDWIAHLGLKSLSETDFQLLTDEHQTLSDFHALIRRYQS